MPRDKFLRATAASLALAMAITASPFNIGPISVNAAEITSEVWPTLKAGSEESIKMSDMIAQAPLESDDQTAFTRWFTQVSDYATEHHYDDVRTYSKSGLNAINDTADRNLYKAKTLAYMKLLVNRNEITAENLLKEIPDKTEGLDAYSYWFLKVSKWAEKNKYDDLQKYASEGFTHVNDTDTVSVSRTKSYSWLYNHSIEGSVTENSIITDAPNLKADRDQYAIWFLKILDVTRDDPIVIDSNNNSVRAFAQDGFDKITDSQNRIKRRAQILSIYQTNQEDKVYSAEELVTMTPSGADYVEYGVWYRRVRNWAIANSNSEIQEMSETAFRSLSDVENETEYTAKIPAKLRHVNESVVSTDEVFNNVPKEWDDQNVYADWFLDALSWANLNGNTEVQTAAEEGFNRVTVRTIRVSDRAKILRVLNKIKKQESGDKTGSDAGNDPGSQTGSSTGGSTSGGSTETQTGGSTSGSGSSSTGTGSNTGSNTGSTTGKTSGDSKNTTNNNGKPVTVKSKKVTSLSAVYVGEGLREGSQPDKTKFVVTAAQKDTMSDGSVKTEDITVPVSGNDSFTVTGSNKEGTNPWTITYQGVSTTIMLTFTAKDDTLSNQQNTGNNNSGNTGNTSTDTNNSSADNNSGSNTGTTGDGKKSDSNDDNTGKKETKKTKKTKKKNKRKSSKKSKKTKKNNKKKTKKNKKKSSKKPKKNKKKSVKKNSRKKASRKNRSKKNR